MPKDFAHDTGHYGLAGGQINPAGQHGSASGEGPLLKIPSSGRKLKPGSRSSGGCRLILVRAEREPNRDSNFDLNKGGDKQ